MRVIVTGGAGFIGSHVVRALVARGDDVTVLDVFDDAYDPAIKEQNVAGCGARVVRGDVTDAAVVEAVARGAEVIVHLAARAGVRESLGREALYGRVNVEGTAVVLEVAQRVGARVVAASSSSVYGARRDGPFREGDVLGAPASPYAATKQAAEALCRAAFHAHGTPVTVLRPFTVYGPRQRPGMAIGRFVRAALTGEPAPLFGDGSMVRDYTYVGDVVTAVLAAIDRPLGHAVINVGSGAPIRLDDLVRLIERVVGGPVPLDRRPEPPGDVPLTWADPSRARDLLGWAAKVSLDEGLRHTAEWFAAGGP